MEKMIALNGTNHLKQEDFDIETNWTLLDVWTLLRKLTEADGIS